MTVVCRIILAIANALGVTWIMIVLPSPYGRNHFLMLMVAVLAGMLSYWAVPPTPARTIVFDGFFPPMHRLNRGIIAIVVPVLLIWAILESEVLISAYDLNTYIEAVLAGMILLYLPALACCFGTYQLLTRYWGTQPRCQCRACGGTLSGLTEPVCPECGERI